MGTDPNNHGRVSQSRRSFLGSSVGIAGLSLDGLVTGDDSDNGHPQFAVNEHDHSGEFGTSTRLGERAPVESITVDTLRTKGAPLRDVTAYGAAGDGTTDDAAPIQAALDDAADGDVIFFPPGEYACSRKITFEDDERSISLLGTGMGSSEITFTGDEGGFLFQMTGPYDGADPQNLNVRGLTLRATTDHEQALTATWPNHNRSTQSSTCTIRDLEIEGPWTNGIYLYHAWNSLIDNLKGRGRWEGDHDRSAGSVIELDGYTVDTVVSNMLIYGFGTGVTVSNEAEGVHLTNVTLVAVDKGFVFGEGLYFTVLDSHVNSLGNGPALDIEGASEVYVSGSLLWNIFRGSDKAPTVRYTEGEGEAVGRTNGLKIVNSQLFGTSGGLEAVGASEVSVASSTIGYGNPETTAIRLEDVDKAQIVNNFVNDAGAALKATKLYNTRIVGNTFDTETGIEIQNGINNVVESNLTYEDAQYLVRQGANNNVPENAHNPDTQGLPSIADTYGQSFTVPQGFDEVETLLANFQNEDSAFTMTLYEGTPADGDLTELASERVDGFADNVPRTFEFGADSAGTYYLEMSDPEKTPTWWWHEGEEGLVDVGGQAFVDRKTVSKADLGREVTTANFIFGVPR